jgi:hypothetical protein
MEFGSDCALHTISNGRNGGCVSSSPLSKGLLLCLCCLSTLCSSHNLFERLLTNVTCLSRLSAPSKVFEALPCLRCFESLRQGTYGVRLRLHLGHRNLWITTLCVSSSSHPLQDGVRTLAILSVQPSVPYFNSFQICERLGDVSSPSTF